MAAETAQVDGGDADVGGDVAQGHELQQLRVLFGEFQVSFPWRMAGHVGVAGIEGVEERDLYADAEPQPFPFGELKEIVDGDDMCRGRASCHD